MTDIAKKISNGVNKRILLFVSIIGVIVVVGLILGGRSNKNDNSTPSPQNQNLPAFQAVISNEGGVEVAVTPINLSVNSTEWSFEVDMNTHSVELSEDMVSVSKLVLDSGEVINPSGWEGDPSGGHHRSGILIFAAPTKSLSSVTLKILRIGGVPEREFQWSLK